MTIGMILLSSEAATVLKDGGSWGFLSLRTSVPDGLAGVVAVSQRRETNRPTPLQPLNHVLSQVDPGPTALWFRAEADLHALAVAVAARGARLTLECFRTNVPSGFQSPGRAAYVALTYAPGIHETTDRDKRAPELMAWWVSADGVQLIDLEVQPEEIGQTQLAPYWPVAEVQSLTV
jgi:hypothetical protein